MDIPNRYPDNPDYVLGEELPTGFAGLGSKDLAHLNKIIRSLYHTHSMPEEAAKHPSARFRRNENTGASIASGANLNFDSVTVLGEDYVAADWWSSGSPHQMKAPERGVYLLTVDGGWLSTAVPSWWWFVLRGDAVDSSEGGQHVAKAPATLSGNSFRFSTQRIIPMAEGASARCYLEHAGNGGLGEIPHDIYVTMIKIGPYNS